MYHKNNKMCHKNNKMYHKTGDVVIFRNKDTKSLLYSTINHSLDNGLGMILVDVILNNIFYKGVNILIIDNDRVKIDSFQNYSNKEFYYYKLQGTVNDITVLEKMIKKDKSFRKKYINKNNPSIKFIRTFFKKLDFNDTTTDFIPNSISCFRNCSYLKLSHTNNVGKKIVYKNNLNPYAITYFISPIIEYYLSNYLIKKTNKFTPLNKFTPSNKFLYIVLMIFGVISGRIMSILHNNNDGMRIIGAIFFFFAVILFLEHMYGYPALKMMDILCLVVGFRIFLTRFASWLINDINTKIDPITGVPYDVLYYEAIFEGILPTLLCWIIKDKVDDGHIMLVWTFTYSFFRIIIENYKDSYLPDSSPLTMGQIDVIPIIFLSLWLYFTRKNNRKSYYGFFLIILLYTDLCFRVKNIKKRNSKILNIDIILKKSKNYGFMGGILENLTNKQKIIISTTGLAVSTYLKKDFETRILLIMASMLNIGERHLSGYITDYIKFKCKNIGTFNMNLSDIIINLI